MQRADALTKGSLNPLVYDMLFTVENIKPKETLETKVVCLESYAVKTGNTRLIDCHLALFEDEFIV